MADAVQVVRTLLAAHAALTAVVPAASIVAGVVPQGKAAPVIAITHISTQRPQMVAAASGLATSRVQVTVVADTYPRLRQVLGLVRAGVPRSRGTVDGVAVDSILPDSEGPDFTNPTARLFMGTQDFIVTYVDA